MAACEVSEEAFQETAGGGSGRPPANQKVTLLSSTADELVDYVVDCRGKAKMRICVVICHRPPGDPWNSKSLILSLKAALNHLDHGDLARDYLGVCDGDNAEILEEPGDENDTGEGGSGEVPVWCAENIAVDADCDGIADESGQPIY